MTSEEGRPGEAPLHAVAAEFTSPDALLEGARVLRPMGLGRLDAHSPVPIRGMAEVLGLGSSSMTAWAVGGVALGFAVSMALCIYATAHDYVFDIGGRPRVSWPAFVVPSVSTALMTGALAVYLVMLFLNRLPRLNHPVFNIPGFEGVTRDRYFLVIEEAGRPIDPGAIEAALSTLPTRPVSIERVRR